MVNIFNIFNRKPKDPELSWQELQETIASHKKIAWAIETTEGESSYLFSKFYGKPALKVGESWPTCPKTGSEMTFVVQINSKQIPDKSELQFGEGILQVFHSDNCPAETPFEDTIMVRLLDTSSEDLTTSEIPKNQKQYSELQITGWTAQDDYPTPEQCKDLGCELTSDQEKLLSEKGYPLQKDKIFGWTNASKAEYSDRSESVPTSLIQIISNGNARKEFANKLSVSVIQSEKDGNSFQVI